MSCSCRFFKGLVLFGAGFALGAAKMHCHFSRAKARKDNEEFLRRIETLENNGPYDGMFDKMRRTGSFE